MMSIAANTGRSMQTAASFFMGAIPMRSSGRAPRPTGARPPATRTGVPSTRLPGLAITGSPAARPATISMRSALRRPTVTRFSITLPSLTLNTLSTPANVTSADVGTMTARSDWADTIDALANDPGRSRPPGLGTSASIISVRLASSMAGLRRATRPVYEVVSPSTVTCTSWFTRTACASRSGTATLKRSGWTRTIVTAGDPAARYWPTVT